jgi:DNA topoisomerase-6 subunit B
MAVIPPPTKVGSTDSQLGLVFTPMEVSPATKPSKSQAQSMEATVERAQTKKKTLVEKKRGSTAEALAKHQREISVSEFFAKNRHLLGFDNKRKALLTTVKEAVDNSLDACEEAGVLPDIEVSVKQTDQDRFRVRVRDNGPGIVKQQIPNIFGKLLYGSKFHRLKMSRGQQGIGISAAGMYGLITTGKPIHIISRTGPKAQAHDYTLAIDTKRNKPDIIRDTTVDVDWPRGTQVTIELQGAYNKSRQSVDEYLELTAIANPHARIVYRPPVGSLVEFPRGTEVLPEDTKEIKPHPYGIELGTFIKMLKESSAKNLSSFLADEFSQVSGPTAKKICKAAGVTDRTYLGSITPQLSEKIHKTLQETKLRAPSTNCLAPMGAETILTGLLKGIKAEFYTASTRPPSVYRGNPFQIEVGVAYGGQLGSDHREQDDEGNKNGERVQARVIRFANRVPLLYQQSSCCTFKSVLDTKWNPYGLSQSNGAMPQAPMVILIHMASVWVPFISEGKEAIADYDEIRKEIKRGIAECGRRLGILLRRKRKKVAFAKRRDVFTRYIDEVVDATRSLTRIHKEDFRRNLIELSKVYTAQADMEFDDHGKIIKKQKHPGNDMGLADTIVVDADASPLEPEMLFDVGEAPKTNKKPKAIPRAKKKSKKRKK